MIMLPRIIQKLILLGTIVAMPMVAACPCKAQAQPGASRPTPTETFLPFYLRERMARRVSARRDNNAIVSLMRPLTAPVGRSTVEVLAGGKRVAFGTVVRQDGFIITKASELTDGKPLRIRTFDDRILTATLVGRRRSVDVALLKVKDQRLVPITWSKIEPPVGSFIVSVGRVGDPVGIGVVSVAAREVADRGKLGVNLEVGSTGGARVLLVVPGSGAAEAGIKEQDIITSVNGVKMSSHREVTARLDDLYPGDQVRLGILRKGEEAELSIVAEIRELAALAESKDDTRVNGPRNNRLAGFELALQHDTVLGPDQCGGPVVDTSGRVIGINIARAGRVCSYCVPATAIAPVVSQLIASANSATN